MPPGGPPDPVPAEIAERILDGLHGGMSLTAICAQPGMPAPRTVSGWKAKDPQFRAAYNEARAEGAQLVFDEAGAIVDAATPADHHVAKLRADHRYRRAACFCPGVFGQKAQLEHSGPDGGGIVLQVVTGLSPPDLPSPAADDAT